MVDKLSTSLDLTKNSEITSVAAEQTPQNDVVNEMQVYLESSQKAFEDLKRQFPDEMLKKAESDIPAMEALRMELLGLAN